MIGVYIRVSTEKQTIRGHSAYEQKSKAIKYIQESYGLNQNYKLYDDSGHSGKNFNRPAIKELMQDMLTETISEVVFWSIDRISRNLVKMNYFIEHAKETNVKLTCLTADVSTDTPEQFLFVMMQSLFAQYERDKISQRTIQGIQGGLRKGFYAFGGKAPFGYRRIGKHLAIQVSEANEISKLFQLFLFKEMSVNSLIEHYKLDPEAKLPPENIPKILRDPLYCGKKVYQDEEFDIAPAIIHEEIFSKVQDILNRKTRIRVNTYLFGGKLFCSECGKTLISVSTNKKEKTYLYYMCANKSCACYKSRLAESKILDLTVNTLDKLLAEKEKNATPNIKEKNAYSKVKNIQKKIDDLKKKKKIASKYLIDSILDPKEYTKQIKDINSNIHYLKKEIDIASQDIKQPNQRYFSELSLQQQVQFIKRHFPNQSVDIKRKKLKSNE